jgi:hypothetical protein
MPDGRIPSGRFYSNSPSFIALTGQVPIIV